MDTAENAWKKFALSGKAEDYCIYRAACRGEAPPQEKGINHAPEHRRLGDTGTEYR